MIGFPEHQIKRIGNSLTKRSYWPVGALIFRNRRSKTSPKIRSEPENSGICGIRWEWQMAINIFFIAHILISHIGNQ